MSAFLKVSLICTSILVLNGCVVMTVVSGVVGAVDSVAKEIKINKLEKKLNELKKGKEDGAELGSIVGKSTKKDMHKTRDQ